MATKKKYVKCFCSGWKINKTPANDRQRSDVGRIRGETSNFFNNCECTVNGSRLTKPGRDDVQVQVNVSTRKGYEASL